MATLIELKMEQMDLREKMEAELAASPGIISLWTLSKYRRIKQRVKDAERQLLVRNL